MAACAPKQIPAELRTATIHRVRSTALATTETGASVLSDAEAE